MAAIVKYARVRRYVSPRSRTRDRAETTYVFHAATPRTHCARPTRPLSSLSETDGAWRKGEGQREKEKKLETVLEKERSRPYVRIHFIGRKNPPGNYRQIYADIRRTAIAKGISRSKTPIDGAGTSGKGREKIKRASMINRGMAGQTDRRNNVRRCDGTLVVAGLT